MHLLIVAGCQVQGKEPANPDKRDVTQRDLYRAARSQQKILLVDGWEEREFQTKVRSLVNEFHSENWELVVKDHREVSVEELTSTPVMLIGTPDQNSWIMELMEELPFELKGGSISLVNSSFASDRHAVVLSYYPNPLNVKMPIGVFTSDNESLIWELVHDRITSFLRTGWNYEILEENQRVLLGNLSQHPDTRWEFDTGQQIELPAEAVQNWTAGPFVFHSYHHSLNSESMQFLSTECQRELFSIQQLSGKKLDTGPINYYLYPTTEIKGLMTGSTDQSHLDSTRKEVHTAFDKHFLDRYYGKENQLILKLLLGPPAFEALETGLSVYFSSHWEKQGYQYWARHLVEGENSMTVEQLLDPEQFMNSSRLIREALSGSLVKFLLDKWGREQFLIKYGSWQPGFDEMTQITDSWWSSLEGKDIVYTPVVKSDLPYLQGFNFTHEGYQVFNGYGSKMAKESMERVRNLGSNVVAIVPYSWMGDPQSPTNFRFSQRAGSENDESVIHTISQAKEQGLFTLLKPHVWIHNSWPGEVEMTTEQDWNLFFEHYYQWISHYALMAEMHEVDVLCIGVEFTTATLKQENHWRNLIGKLRNVYSGHLTYAANWGDEFEQVTFWDQLDLIGLNCYYPLSNNSKSNQNELEHGFASVLDKVDKVKTRYNKPLLITEIGFRSVEAPWMSPHEEAGNKNFNEDDQAKAYSAVFQVLANTTVVDGIFWWKWPTNLEHRSEQDRRFVPYGKKSEKVIDHWFKQNDPLSGSQ
jgi:hypothetical protein